MDGPRPADAIDGDGDADADPRDSPATSGLDRRRAGALVVPFLLLGLADVALVVGWGLRPAWGLLVLAPVVFVSAVAWLSFRGGFLDRRDVGR